MARPPGRPGALLAGLGAAGTAIALLTGHRRRAAQYLAAGGFAILAMWVTLVSSWARVDFHVEMGHDLRARGAVWRRRRFDAARRHQAARPGGGRPLPPLQAPDAGLE